MLKYTVKRLLQSLVTIFLIATAVFLMMRCLPTDYYFTEEQLMKFTDQQKTAALEAAGLTDPIPTQLVMFYNNLLHLDFGTPAAFRTVPRWSRSLAKSLVSPCVWDSSPPASLWWSVC